MAGWHYVKSSILGDEEIGPISGDRLLQLAQDGTINLDTKIVHEKHTKGKWISMERVPVARKKFESGQRQRAEQAEEKQEHKKAVRDQLKRDKEEEKQRRAEEEAEALANLPFANLLGDGQDPKIIGKAYDRIIDLLTAEEIIEYIAVALHVPGFHSPDCVVATNRRFMVVRQKLLGRMDFQDFLWVDLRDAKLKEGVMSAEVSFSTTDGQVVKVDYLPKVQARKVYTFCQQQEEGARELRRERQLEDKRATANNVNVTTAQPGASPPPAASPAPAEDDPVQKLSKLKQMVDAGLIEQDEYNTAKTRILEAM